MVFTRTKRECGEIKRGWRGQKGFGGLPAPQGFLWAVHPGCHNAIQWHRSDIPAPGTATRPAPRAVSAAGCQELLPAPAPIPSQPRSAEDF